MSSTQRPSLDPTIARLKLHLFQLGRHINQWIQTEMSPEERRAGIETPYALGSAAAEDYIDGYVDYQNASMRFESLQCRGDRSSHYGQGWQACAHNQASLLSARRVKSQAQASKLPTEKSNK